MRVSSRKKLTLLIASLGAALSIYGGSLALQDTGTPVASPMASPIASPFASPVASPVATPAT